MWYVCGQKSEDSFQVLGLFFYHVSTRDQTWVIHQAWRQAPFPAEPALQPVMFLTLCGLILLRNQT